MTMIFKHQQYIIFALVLFSILSISYSKLEYSKYDYYPKYCSHPGEMHKRTIPALNSSKFPQSKILQVNAVIRHGARTPWSKSGQECWTNYYKNNGGWDCTLRSVFGPPVIHDDNIETFIPKFLFEKDYSPHQTHNILNGTCQAGQLIQAGYDQLLQNGKILRQAYKSPRQHANLDLFAQIRKNDSSSEPHSYFRSDDFQRTIMSGQVLLQSFHGLQQNSEYQTNRLNLHTGDVGMDVFTPNPRICPRLLDAKESAVNSLKYYAKMNSPDIKTLLQEWKKIGGADEVSMMDCLMTTICSDRKLPKSLDNFNGNETSTESLFSKIINLETWKTNYINQFNNAEFAKLSMGPLWAEILDNIFYTLQTKQPHKKLVVYSGHDSTIMPLLTTLGPKFYNMSWTPYASMVLIEIHDVSMNANKKVKHAFRVVYNGEVVTHKVNGCPQQEQLCNLNSLLFRIQPIAKRKPLCTNTEEKNGLPLKASSSEIYGFLLLSLICAGIGSLFTYVYISFLSSTSKVEYDSSGVASPPSKKKKKKEGVYELTDSFDYSSNENNNGSQRSLQEKPDVTFL